MLRQRINQDTIDEHYRLSILGNKTNNNYMCVFNIINQLPSIKLNQNLGGF